MRAPPKKIMVAHAGSSSTTQMEQVENFTAMNVKVIAVMPIDPEGMIDVVKKAHDAGIKTMIAGGTFPRRHDRKCANPSLTIL